MAKCSICGKGVHFGNNVSHSHRRSNKMWKPNVKSVRCKVNGGTKKMYVWAMDGPFFVLSAAFQAANSNNAGRYLAFCRAYPIDEL